MTGHCLSCKHFERSDLREWELLEEPSPAGFCHWGPPTMHYVDGALLSCFPEVYAEDWCGKWEPLAPVSMTPPWAGEWSNRG